MSMGSVGVVLSLVVIVATGCDSSGSFDAATPSQGIEVTIVDADPGATAPHDDIAPDSISTMPDTSTALDTTYPSGPDEVVIQIGLYDLGLNIDEFVSPPRLVLYGDGTAYTAPGARRTGRTAQLDAAEIRGLIASSATLPDDAESGESPTDTNPLLIYVNGRSWYVNDERTKAFADYVSDLIDSVNQGPSAEWTPDAWIERIPPTDTCTIVEEPTEHLYYAAPIYPHMIDRFGPDTVQCSYETGIADVGLPGLTTNPAVTAED